MALKNVSATLKRGIKGTFHYVSVKYLERYMNEFAFQLNEGKCEVDMEDLTQALFQAMAGKRLSYRELIDVLRMEIDRRRIQI